MLINAVFKILGAVLERPIYALDSYLQPIRDALYRLYLLLRELIMFVDQLIMFPVNLIYMYYEIFRTSFSLFGFPSALPRFNDGFGLLQPFDNNTCNAIMGKELNAIKATCNADDEDKSKPVVGPLMIVFVAISNINPFRLADLFFSKSFRDELLGAIKIMFDLVFLVFRYILIAIRVIEKLILLAVDLIGQVIALIENVVTIDNISEFILVIIYCAIIIGSLIGVNQLIKTYEFVKVLITGTVIGNFLGFGGDDGGGGGDDGGGGGGDDEKKAEVAKKAMATMAGGAKFLYENINEIANKLNKMDALNQIHKK
jgi:hypothetical protein